jgi:hypothetical protein
LTISTLLDIFHTTPQSSQRLIPIAFDNPCVASVAALRETKMSSSVDAVKLKIRRGGFFVTIVEIKNCR